MTESTLKAYSTKQLETLMDYVGYLKEISSSFVIGTSKGVYAPKYRGTFSRATVSDADYTYELCANSAREMAEAYYKHLGKVDEAKLVERAMRCRQILSLNLRDPDSRAQIMQLGYADELVRRKNEISEHNLLCIDLSNLVPALDNSLRLIEAMRQASDNSSKVSAVIRQFLPMGDLNVMLDEAEEHKKQLQNLLERERLLLGQKNHKLDELIGICYCDKEQKLPENFSLEKDVVSLILCEKRRVLANDIACQYADQYHDDEADRLRNSVEAFLKANSQVQHQSQVYSLCWRLIEMLSGGGT